MTTAKKTFANDTPTLAEIRALKTPRLKPVDVPLDGGVFAEIVGLQAELRFAEREDQRLNRPPQAPALRRRIDEILDGMRTATFVFRELPKNVYRELIERHPPIDKRLRWNPKTFEPALIAACCIQPKVSLTDIEEMFANADEAWGEAEFRLLFDGALEVNEATARVPFGGNGSEPTTSSEPSSTSAAGED